MRAINLALQRRLFPPRPVVVIPSLPSVRQFTSSVVVSEDAEEEDDCGQLGAGGHGVCKRARAAFSSFPSFVLSPTAAEDPVRREDGGRTFM